MTKRTDQAEAKTPSINTDGWANLIAMLGVQGRDKRTGHRVLWVPMTQTDAENLYSADDSAGKIVDDVVDDGVREWICFKDMPPEIEKKVWALHDALMVRERFAEGWRWGRLYGGAGAIPLFAGDSNVTQLTQPLPENPGELKGLLVLSRWELTVDQLDEDILSTNFGKPKTYNISPQTNAASAELGTVKVHYTRVFRFDGSILPRRHFVTNNYWHDSVLNRAKDAIRDYNFAFDAANAVLGDFSVSKFKLKNLADLVASGKELQIKQRIDIAAISKSVLRAVAVDADSEDWEEVARSMTGVPEVMTKASQRLVAASKLPHTKMLGESPSGLGATGRSEERNYYDYVAYRQELDIAKNLDKVLNLIVNQVTGGKPPEGWSWEFKPLWQLTELEEADRYQKTAQADAVYLQNQVVDPSEVATSRFGGDSYGSKIKLTIGREQYAPGVEEPGAVPPGTTGAVPTGGAAPGQDIQRQALNGAQVSSLLQVVGQLAIGNLPRETAKAILVSAFPIDPTAAEAILGSIGQGFEPAAPELLVAGRSGGTPPGAGAAATTTDEEEQDAEPTTVQTLIFSKERFKSGAEARQWASRNGKKSDKVDETEDSFRLRQMEPDLFVEGSFRTIALSSGIKAVVGKLKE